MCMLPTSVEWMLETRLLFETSESAPTLDTVLVAKNRAIETMMDAARNLLALVVRLDIFLRPEMRYRP